MITPHGRTVQAYVTSIIAQEGRRFAPSSQRDILCQLNYLVGTTRDVSLSLGHQFGWDELSRRHDKMLVVEMKHQARLTSLWFATYLQKGIIRRKAIFLPFYLSSFVASFLILSVLLLSYSWITLSPRRIVWRSSSSFSGPRYPLLGSC